MFLHYLWNFSHNQHDIVIVSTEVSRKVHCERKSWIVDVVLRLQSYWIEWIRLEDHSSFLRRERYNLTVGGDTFIKNIRSPGLVPGAHWVNDLVLVTCCILKVSVWTTRVPDTGVILNTARPLPGPTGWSLRWFISAINSYMKPIFNDKFSKSFNKLTW